MLAYNRGFKRFLINVVFLGLLCVAAFALESNSPDKLVGNWRIDLRPTPDAEPYYQEMRINSVDGNTLTGRFYGATIRNGRLNLDWGAVRFAFVTEDGSGEYHTSGTLRDGKIEGLTHAIGREFLAYWTAEKINAEK